MYSPGDIVAYPYPSFDRGYTFIVLVDLGDYVSAMALEDVIMMNNNKILPKKYITLLTSIFQDVL